MRALKIVLRVALVILITLVALEGALRLFAPRLPGQIGVVARYVTTGQPFSEQWTPAWRENRDHYYTLRPGITDALQYGSPSVSFQLTTHKLWDDGLPPDEGIGFRTSPVDFAVDAVVVGDSFGFCFTEQTDCWVDVWARNAGINVVNLSTPVTGSISHARMVQDFAAPLEPPLIVWQFFGNDFYDDYVLHVWRGDIDSLSSEEACAAQPGSWLARNTVVGALTELVATGTWSGLPASERAYQPRYSAPYPGGTLQFGKCYELTALDMNRPENEYGYEQTRQALEDAKAAVEAWGGELVIVIIPTREEVYSDMTVPVMGQENLETLASARDTMLDLCMELAIECLDPTDELSGRGQNTALYYADDMHLNAAGNAALAEILQGWLETIRDGE
jgi:lysophospholipase L1-like esterase